MPTISFSLPRRFSIGFRFFILSMSAIASPQAFAADAKPNVIIIYADDWGWGDLACHGHPELKTPNLDRLAREGTDFHHFVVCNPVCSPSRTALMTGQYPARFRIHQHFAQHSENVARGMPDWLEPNVPNLASSLRGAGYKTAHFGKWHLSGQGADIDAPLPSEYGFDEAAVWTGPGRDVFTGTSVAQFAGSAHDKSGASYQTIAATEHALRFIRKSANQPFFMNVWLHETHHLVSATDEQKQPYPNTKEPQRTYYSAVTRADNEIGKILNLLDELKLADNTVVIFSSDNGPENSMELPDQKFYFSVGVTGGLRGRKRSLYMGGVNVPFIVRWPGQVPSGRVDSTSVFAGVDVLPTILETIGLPLPANTALDGENVIAAWRGQDFKRSRPLFWEWRGPNLHAADWPQLAIRDGFETLLMSFDRSQVELYDLTKDRAQENNLAASQPDRVADLMKQLLEWKSNLPDPSMEAARSTPAKRSPKAAAAPTRDRNEVFDRLDRNHDGKLTLEEYQATLQNPSEAPGRFERFDRSRDGLLSREEFVRP